MELVVRVNNQRTKFGLLDLEAFVSSEIKIKAIMLPKVKTPDEIKFIDDLLTDCNLDTDLHVIMETNEALENIYDIAHASKRTVALYFGGVDMAAELRVDNKWENLLYARSKLVHAGASAGQHDPRTRAWHHHQEPCHTHAAFHRRQRLCVEPDGHTWTCRLFV